MVDLSKLRDETFDVGHCRIIRQVHQVNASGEHRFRLPRVVRRTAQVSALDERLDFADHAFDGLVVEALDSLLCVTILLVRDHNFASQLACRTLDEVDLLKGASKREASIDVVLVPVGGQTSHEDLRGEESALLGKRTVHP